MDPLPKPREWLPVSNFGERLCRTSIDVTGLTIQELAVYLDQVLTVCRDRCFYVQGIGLPAPALRELTDVPPGAFDPTGQYCGILLYAQDDYPVPILELAFNSVPR